MPKRIYLSEEMTIRLIKEVKNRPCLWNPECEDYHVKYVVGKAWDDISSIMDLSDNVLRSKWKNLRDTYKKELKKFDGAYGGTWHYFTPLKFLVFKKDSTENDNDVAEKETEDESDESEEHEIKYETVEPKMEAYWSDEDPISEQRNQMNENDADFDLMFLKSLAPYFRQLGPMRRLIVRNKMQDMLLNEIAAQSSNTRSSMKS